MAYEWFSDVQASLYIALSGYLAATGYNINSKNLSNNLNLRIGYPDDLTYITDRTIVIEQLPTFNTVADYQLAPGQKYNSNVDYHVLTKTDRDVEVLLYQLSLHFRECPPVYDWGVAVTGGLSVGATDFLITFENQLLSRLRPEKLESNELLNHKGSARVSVSFDSDSLV